MKTIDIEKTIRIEGINDVISLTFHDEFKYLAETGGIRCCGPFKMEGRYTTDTEVKDIKEVFDFDVFASNDKLGDEKFEIQFSDHDYEVLDNEVKFMFHFSIYGLIDEDPSPEDEEVETETVSELNEDNDVDFSMMEELFEANDNVSTSYSFVVIKEGDTYTSIAQRYEVDENELINVNNNKVLTTQSLLVLPIK